MLGLPLMHHSCTGKTVRISVLRPDSDGQVILRKGGLEVVPPGQPGVVEIGSIRLTKFVAEPRFCLVALMAGKKVGASDRFRPTLPCVCAHVFVLETS
jgi:hypothetical protein